MPNASGVPVKLLPATVVVSVVNWARGVVVLSSEFAPLPEQPASIKATTSTKAATNLVVFIRISFESLRFCTG